MRLVLFGAPGVGKGTQAELLCERHALKHISTGDLLRSAIRAQTPLGVRAKTYMDGGNLVPGSLVRGLAEEAIAAAGYDRFILDGYPRTVEQARWLGDFLIVEDAPLTAVLSLAVPIELVVARLSRRRVHRDTGESYHLDFKPPPKSIDPLLIIQRPDDHEEAIRQRMEVYFAETAPVVNFYRGSGIYYEVDGVGEFEDVYARVEAALQQAALVQPSA